MTVSEFVARSRIDAPAEELYGWHVRPGALERLMPPWEHVAVLEAAPAIRDGSRVVLRIGRPPLAVRWVAVHEGVEPGRGFRDVQWSGPMAEWVHAHRFLPASKGSTLEDAIRYRLPLGALGRLLGAGRMERRLRRMFTYRHALTRADLERHGEIGGGRRLHVAISGASGLVGAALTAFLRAGGHRVSRMVRREPRAGAGEILFDPQSGRLDARRLAPVDAVVHLAGESIAARWTPRRKRRIRESRVLGTRLVAETLARPELRTRVLVNASAIGYYGNRGDETLDEDSGPGGGFLPETCVAWEAATASAERAGLRVVRLRIGMVLAAAGGALARMLPPFLVGAGGRIGSGRQYVSWIALDDLVGVIHRALFDERLVGPVNAVAPGALRNAEFSATLARVLRRPALVPLPAFAVRTAFGEMGRELLLAGSRVVPSRLHRAGFRFRHGELEPALRFELGRDGARGAAPSFEIRRRGTRST